MPEVIYILCGLCSALCAALLLRGYFRSRSVLLMWASISFTFLCLNNIALIFDRVVFPEPEVDLSMLRNILGLAAVSTMLVGYIWSSEMK